MPEDAAWRPQSYLDQIRPESGWSVTLGLFATYSAELFSVAATLLALTGRQNGRGSGTSASIIEAVDQLRPCVRIMAQTGRIAPPDSLPRIAGIFDQFIVDVPFPESERSWHPKIALVRYASPTRGERWRLWIGSRNLTGSRDLEAGLLLESSTRRTGRGRLAGVGELASLLARRSRIAGIDPSALADELDQLRWNSPAGVTPSAVELRPGDETRGYGPPPGDIDRLVVVSPFLCPEFVRKAGAWGTAGTRRTLVSTEAAIRAIGASKRSKLDRFQDLLAFDAPELFSPPETPSSDESSEDAETDPISLHAKLLAFDQPRRRVLVLGSANATDRAWSGRNAEVFATLDVDEEVLAGVYDLCARARRIELRPDDDLERDRRRETRFEGCRKDLSSAWQVELLRDGGEFVLLAECSPRLPAGYGLQASLATQAEWFGWKASQQCALGHVALSDQTGLVRFRLTGDGEESQWVRALSVTPPIPDERDLAAFGRHLGARALSAWLRGRFHSDLDVLPGDEWDRTDAPAGTRGGKVADDERITLEEILLAWARDPGEFARIKVRFGRLLDAVIDHGDERPEEHARLRELREVWTLAQQRLAPRR